MRRLFISLFLLSSSPCFAIPVIPNFSAGSSISRTTSSQSTREIIQSYSYSTGYQYTTGGTNVEAVTAGGTITYSGGSSTGQSIGITSVAGGTITLSPGAAGSSVTGSITSSIEIE